MQNAKCKLKSVTPFCTLHFALCILHYAGYPAHGGKKHGPRARRRGAVGTLDYVLVLAVMLPMVVLVMFAGPRMIRAVYEMLCVMISWPFP